MRTGNTLDDHEGARCRAEYGRRTTDDDDDYDDDDDDDAVDDNAGSGVLPPWRWR